MLDVLVVLVDVIDQLLGQKVVALRLVQDNADKLSVPRPLGPLVPAELDEIQAAVAEAVRVLGLRFEEPLLLFEGKELVLVAELDERLVGDEDGGTLRGVEARLELSRDGDELSQVDVPGLGALQVLAEHDELLEGDLLIPSADPEEEGLVGRVQEHRCADVVPEQRVETEVDIDHLFLGRSLQLSVVLCEAVRDLPLDPREDLHHAVVDVLASHDPEHELRALLEKLGIVGVDPVHVKSLVRHALIEADEALQVVVELLLLRVGVLRGDPEHHREGVYLVAGLRVLNR